MPKDNNKILLVDDDHNILEGFKRTLRNQFTIVTAEGGEKGLDAISTSGPFSVIVSDLRMPEMDGIKFLAQANELTPESVRILLTGHADLGDAIAAINEGQIFRFLTKPCDNEVFVKTLRDGIEQHYLIIAEKELLNRTLKGIIKLLVDILSIVSPYAFSRAIRIRSFAKKLALRLKVENLWQVDVAALLSQIGCVTISPEILRRKFQGEPLSEADKEVFFGHMKVGKDLLANIPRFDEIAEAIAYQEKRYDGGGSPNIPVKGKEIPFLARILKVVLDYDSLLATGMTQEKAIEEMRHHLAWYDPKVLAALNAEALRAEKGYVVKEIGAADIEDGMVLADDIRTKSGILLVPKRCEISPVLRMRILNFSRNSKIAEPIRIMNSVDRFSW